MIDLKEAERRQNPTVHVMESLNSSDSSSLKSQEDLEKISKSSNHPSQDKISLPKISLNKSSTGSVSSIARVTKGKHPDGTEIEKNFSFGKNLEKGRRKIAF